ncbi:paired amphipathic helix protein Sin3-like 2 [Camellia sinensis]|uniref:paired amphipathic helix protein Sin3-like 2 n=1 Tax=Camellia sinensis TaxID=4442 RepID=UPI0010366FC6|nr:paired amphipathic helix protein Sin3-like 2 [Camellia sinensis]
MKSAQKVEDFGVNLVLASCDDKEALRSMYKQEFIFCAQVKERLRSSNDYQAFLKCLYIYSTEIITKKYLQSLMTLLRGLLEIFWCMEKKLYFCIEVI